MVAVVTPDVVTVPEHPEGGRWAVIWAAADSPRTIFADSVSEVIAEIIPGYAEAWEKDDFDQLLNLRINVLVQLANVAQAGALAAVDEPLTEEQIKTLLASKEEPVKIRDWEPAVPLVLIVSCYEPYTTSPRPNGAIKWLSPESEVDFLASLSTLGAGHLWVSGTE